MDLNTLDDLLIDRLTGLYDAERQLAAAVRQLAAVSAFPDLHETLDEFQQIASDNISRIHKAFTLTGAVHSSTRSETMEALIREAIHLVQRTTDPIVKDSGMVSVFREMSHYLIAGYWSVRSFARELGHREAADVLQQCIDEEMRIEKALTDVVQGGLLRTGLHHLAPRR